MTTQLTQGLFIVFEGGNGTGKDTYQKMAAAYLKDKYGLTVISTQEQNSSAVSKEIRALAKNYEVSEELFLELLGVERRTHLNEVVCPALIEDDVVLCNRYWMSTVVYQSALNGLDFRHVMQSIVRHVGMAMLIPDLTFHLTGDPFKVAERVKKRGEGGSLKTDRVCDSYDQIFNCMSAYSMVFSQALMYVGYDLKDKTVQVNTTDQSEEETFEVIAKSLDALIEANKDPGSVVESIL